AGVRDAGAAVEAERLGTRRPAGERSGQRPVARGHPARGTQASGVSRRELLPRATALVAGATVLDQLPHALRLQGWLEDAYAAGPNVVAQTMKGLAALIVPGREPDARAQGTRSKTPGAIEAGTTAALTRTLDRFL